MNGKGGSKRGSNGNAGVSLFPFLAVLLCTMGALIMLLVVIARNVREGQPEPPPVAVQESQSDETVPQWTADEAAKTLKVIRENIEEAEWFAENFEKTKADAEEQLAEARAVLASAEKETQKVKDEIARLAKLSEQLDNPDTATSGEIERLKKLLVERTNQRQQAELELAELQKEAENSAKSYAIIPYRGTAGTFRRPIYIECRKDKVIIQPEGVELGPNDFAVADRPDNPMDAALRVVRQYYMENNQIVRGTEPYPLLIVRPSGVETYAVARGAIGSWVQEYGYELVDEDWKIEYPEPSAELRERIEKQLETSRRRMIGYMTAMAAQRAREPRRQYRVDSRGTVQPIEGRGPGETFSAGKANRPGRGFGGGMPGGSGGSGGLAGRPGLPEALQGQGGVDEGGNGSVGTANSLRGPGSGVAAGSGWEAAQGMTSTSASASGSAPQGETDGEPNHFGGDTFQSGASSGFAGQSDQALRERTAAVGTPYASQFGSFEGTPGTQDAATGMRSDSARFNGADATAYGSNTSDATPMGADAAGAAQPGQPGMLQGKLSRMNAAQASGENWGLRDKQPFSSPVSRNIKIQCGKNRFVLVQQPGLVGVRVVPITDSVRASTGKLVQAIWEYMDSWGMAGEKMYWRPVLLIDVEPGGEQRFEELRQLLQGSGFVIEKVG